MCPVCYFGSMPYPAEDYNICPCCGTEFENHDDNQTHAELRQDWMDNGAKWFFREAPTGWNAWQQLANAGVRLPYTTNVFYVSSPIVIENYVHVDYNPVLKGVYMHYTGSMLGDAPLNLHASAAEDDDGEAVLTGQFTHEAFGIAA
jgi:hypothetical protein